VLDAADDLSYQWDMPKAAKVSEPEKTDNLPFEEALKRLETIVEAMESEDLPLETLLARFEEGTKLVKQCSAKLAEAELKIQKLEKNSAGELVLKTLSPDLSEAEQ
jgi:exodeoxyribonuclease VII small subunit